MHAVDTLIAFLAMIRLPRNIEQNEQTIGHTSVVDMRPGTFPIARATRDARTRKKTLEAVLCFLRHLGYAGGHMWQSSRE